MTDLAFTPAVELARMIRDREVSSRELTQLYLDRIDEHDDEVNSHVHLFPDDALERASSADERLTAEGPDELPPFHGVPVSVKELSFLEGKPATMASQAMAGFTAPFTSEPVARLLRAGMVTLGKTNAPELGTVPITEPQLFGPCRNPWALDRTPGGSSGGAAAAVAAGLAPAAHGSDGGGSIRIPAGHCGVYGLKPTRDRISHAPFFGEHAFGLTSDGMLTRTVADTAAFLDILSGYVPGDPGAAPQPERPFIEEVGADPGSLRIGVAAENPLGDVAPVVAGAIDDARGLLEELGHGTTDVSLGVGQDVAFAFGRIWQTLFASYPLPQEDLEPMNRWYIARGHEVTGPEYLQAQFQLQLHARRFTSRFHGEFDLLLIPVVTRLPFRIGELDDLEPPERFWEIARYVGATPIANSAGLPAAAIPFHWDDATGLPIGVQLIGRFADEATLLRVSTQVEEARSWRDRRPPGFG